MFGITAINAVSPVCFALDPPTLVQTSIATLFRNQPSVDFIHCYGLRLLRRRERPTDVVVWLLASTICLCFFFFFFFLSVLLLFLSFFLFSLLWKRLFDADTWLPTGRGVAASQFDAEGFDYQDHVDR